MSVQYVAEPSQKFTWPGAIGTAPAFTVAVTVIRVPEATELTTVVPEVTASVVVVAVFCAIAVKAGPQSAKANARCNHPRNARGTECFDIFGMKRRGRTLTAGERTMAELTLNVRPASHPDH